MTYRPDIDGLRAVAVLFVISYHLGVLTTGVGFAGVDIFFVISGYLIGGQILQQKAAGTFSFRAFYARRARRILPALFVTILVAIAVGWAIMLPSDYRYFLGGAAAALLSVSNFWFAERIDYFNPEAANDPLIHTWTLGVEEQFYLVVPLLIVAVWTCLRARLFAVLLALALASYGLSVWLSHTSPQISYYLLPTRAWELLAGVLVAMAEPRLRSRLTRRARGITATLSLVLLVTAMLVIPHDADWPGMHTLLVVLPTAALLATGDSRSPGGAALSLGPMRGVGLISYSAYLVHQPILGFLAYAELQPHSAWTKLAVFSATLGLAYLSWRFVETPFRTRRIPPLPGRSILALSAMAILGIAVGGHVSKGYPHRIPDDIHAILGVETAFAPNYRRCLHSRADVAALTEADFCTLGPDQPPEVAIWGDSHGAALLDALSGDLSLQGLSTRAYLLSSCLPVPGLLNAGQKRSDQCAAFNDRVLSDILSDRDVRVIVLVATWDNYVLSEDTPDMFGRRGGDGFFAYPANAAPDMADAARRDGVGTAVEALLSTLVDAGKGVVVVQSAPRPDVAIPRFAARQVWNGQAFPENLSYDRAFFDAQTEVSRRMFTGVLARFDPVKVASVDPGDVLCDATRCNTILSGKILFLDGDHLSETGSRLVSPVVASAVSEVFEGGAAGATK